MVARLLGVALALAGCASSQTSWSGLKIDQSVPGYPRVVRLLLDEQETRRISRAGATDASSESGLTDRFRFQVAIERYIATALKENGLCPDGYTDMTVGGGNHPLHYIITVKCVERPAG